MAEGTPRGEVAAAAVVPRSDRRKSAGDAEGGGRRGPGVPFQRVKAEEVEAAGLLGDTRCAAYALRWGGV